jgi:multidrug efflux pump subunit AcrA (membrane-fusion protein)
VPAVVTCTLAMLFILGAFLLRLEWRRYRFDRSPAPPPTPEEAALDRWNAGVVMLVAGLSIAGALLAWWASSEFSLASTVSQQALAETTQYQTVKAEQDSYIDLGSKLAEQYQQHTVAESSLYQQAASAISAGQTDVARQLEAEARAEGAQARALAPGFVCYWPYSPGTDGSIGYDETAQQGKEVADPCVQPGQDPTALQTLDPAHVSTLESTARADRSTAEEIVMAGALVIVAVFFLTVSYLGWKHRRAHTLAPGVLAIGASFCVALIAGLA